MSSDLAVRPGRPARTSILLACLLAAAAACTPSSALAVDTLYWQGGGPAGGIRAAPLAGAGTVSTLYGPPDVGNGHGLGLDPADERIYWANGTPPEAIKGAPLAGGGTVSTLYPQAQAGNGLTGLTVDPGADRLYWTSPSSLTIRAAPASGAGPVDTVYDFFDGSVTSAQGIAVDPAAGKLYWVRATNDGNDSVVSAPLDGSGPTTVLYDESDGLSNPTGVAVDTTTDRVYWTNYTASYIQGAPTSGAGPVDTVYDFGEGPASPAGIAVDPAGSRMYWINDTDQKVMGAPLSGAGPVDTLYTETAFGFQRYLAVLRVPVSTANPTVTGVGELGQQLSCSTGTWAPDFPAAFSYRAPADFGYQWTLDGNDIGGAGSSTHTPTTVGDYGCRVTASNLAGGTDATSGNTVSVPAANPTLSNQATAAATIGSAISDAATLAASFNPTGTITLTAYGPTDPTCANPPAFTSAPVTASGGGASAQFTPATTGTYRWTASYSGDTNNVAATSACNAANSSSVVNPRPPDPPATAADDPRCERLRAKLTRQKRNLGREHNSQKREQLSRNVRRTRAKMRALGCST